MGALGAWFQRAFTPSKSDGQSGAQYNAAKQQAPGIGNLTEDEAQDAVSSRAFRLGTYFTSPTGALQTAPRRGTKLIGA